MTMGVYNYVLSLRNDRYRGSFISISYKKYKLISAGEVLKYLIMIFYTISQQFKRMWHVILQERNSPYFWYALH